MKSNRIAFILIAICLAAVLLTSCGTKSYGTFKVTQVSGVKGDFILLPSVTVSGDDVFISPDQTWKFPLTLYKAYEAKLTEVVAKHNDFSTGYSDAEYQHLYEITDDKAGRDFITNEKERDAFDTLVVNITSKISTDGKMAALSSEIDSAYSVINKRMCYFLYELNNLYNFANKNSTWYESQEEVFNDYLSETKASAKIMEAWFPNIKPITSFADKTGPDVENPWAADWNALIEEMTAFNNELASAMLRVDATDYDSLNNLYDMMEAKRNTFWDKAYDLPYITKYEDEFDQLYYTDSSELMDKLYDMKWDAYWNYYW